MKFVSFEGGRIGVCDGDDVVDLTPLIDGGGPNWPPTTMVRFVSQYEKLIPAIKSALKSASRRPRASVRLETPIAWPNKLIAFPANYHAHIDEMRSGPGLISTFKADGQGFFLKANSSLSGPIDPIVLPDLPDREIHHECELAVIIGKAGRAITRERAYDYVFGYSCLLDMVVRGKEERVMRKSFDTFCPVGPHIVTRDEVVNPADIDLALWVNGEQRQNANTRDLIVDIPAMIAMASAVMTLYPGDIIASGTPAGVGPVRGGDSVRIAISGVGEMTLDVVQGEHGAHSVWKK
jgi:2-keto-4-pentenoate hydratase/2-oxohepta-3-ene-1,7-dioic acid hydratase in catechol pathway